MSDPRQVRSDGEGRFSLRAPSESCGGAALRRRGGLLSAPRGGRAEGGASMSILRPRALRGVVSMAGVPALEPRRGSPVGCEPLPVAGRWPRGSRRRGSLRFRGPGLHRVRGAGRARVAEGRGCGAGLRVRRAGAGGRAGFGRERARLRVRVVDARGGGAVLGCVLEVRGAARRPIETSDEGGGVFTAPRLTAGAHRVEASCPGGGVAAALVMVPESGEASVELGSGRRVAGLVSWTFGEAHRRGPSPRQPAGPG